ncbi:MAG: hypothetical protein ACTS2F_27890 [Thainema sp.]
MNKQTGLTPQQERWIKMINTAIAGSALMILLGYMIYFLVGAFAASSVTGLRSLFAAVLPFIFNIYITFFSKVTKGRNQTPPFNLYFVFSVWTIMMFIMARNFYETSFPIGELLFSGTFAAIVWSYHRNSLKGFMSCCYGVVTGFLIYMILGVQV